MGHTLIEAKEPDKVYQRIVDAGAFVTRAERCTLALIDPASGRLEVAATRGKSEPVSTTANPQAGAKGLRPVLQEGTSVRLQAASGETITLQTGDRVKAILQVPLKNQGQTVGLLSVDRQECPSPFDDHDELMLNILANCITISLEMQRLTQVAASSTQSDKEGFSGTPVPPARST